MKKHGLVLIGHGSQHPKTTGEFHQFAQSLALRLGIHVQPCFLEFNDPPIAEAIRQCVQMGLTQITVLPLFLSAGMHQKNDVPNIINWARQQWPHVRFQYCAPIGVQYHTLSAMSDRLSAATDPNEQIAAEKTAVAVVGYGTRDPDANAEVARLARLLYEGRDFGWVEPAYYLLTKPDVKTVIQRFAKLGAQRVIVLPYLIFTGHVYERMVKQATQAAADAGLQITIAPYLFPHPALLEAVAERFDEAVNGKANMTCDLCKYRRKMAGQENEFGLAQSATHGHASTQPQITQPSMVYLVGAGPGDPSLITMRGLMALRQADVILYDRLIALELLREAKPEAELVDVGKVSFRTQQKFTQEQINELIIQQAQAGKTVVRLKGGDPFVFGRGGEEALACYAVNVPFTIVPGVSSAIAVPAYAGIPVTHRAYNTSFTVFSGHEDPSKTESTTDFAMLAQSVKSGTLVLLMGLLNLPILLNKLMAAGLDPNTPAACIEWGSTPKQRVVEAIVSNLPARVAEAGLQPPAITIIGGVVALRQMGLQWFD